MIDIHSHLLPGIDDGAQTIEESIVLAKQAVLEGVEHMILTPHHYNHQFINHKYNVIQAAEELQEIYDKEGIALTVYPAQEIRIKETLLDDILYQDDYLPLDEGGKYYLIEMPTKTIPDYALNLVKDMVQNGITPVIAHPERNHVFAKDLKVLRRFIEVGCLGQLTSHSYIGAYGDTLRQISQEMIRQNLVHVIASDAHHITKRPIKLKDAYEQLEKDFDRDTVAYFKQNSRDIINGDNVQVRESKRKKWLGLF